MPARRIAPSLLLAALVVGGQALLDAADQSAVPVALVLHDATPIRLRLTRDLSFTNIRPGEMVYFEVLDDLRIDGILIMSHGDKATAKIIQAEPKTRMGRGGKLGVTLDFLPLVNGGQVAVRPAKERHPSDAVDAAPTTEEAMVRPTAPPVLFTYGKDETFPEGTRMAVYTDGDVQLDPARFLADITFTSNPPGALVSMYGAPVGRTPFTTRLAPGRYKAVFSADGFSNLTQNISVGPGLSNTVYAAFELK